MAGIASKSFDSTDEVRTPDKARIEVVDLGSAKAMRMTAQPGWRWSESVKPVVKTDSCRARHVGTVTAGSFRVRHDDGTEEDLTPGAAYVIEPGATRGSRAANRSSRSSLRVPLRRRTPSRRSRLPEHCSTRPRYVRTDTITPPKFSSSGRREPGVQSTRPVPGCLEIRGARPCRAHAGVGSHAEVRAAHRRDSLLVIRSSRPPRRSGARRRIRGARPQDR